jgi:membrane fusion protein (multidrug efflux system)
MFKQLALIMALGVSGYLPALAAGPITVDGITEPLMDVQLGFANAGIIRHQFFKEGDTVKKGDVILELDKNLETLEVQRRKAVMEQSKMVFESTSNLFVTTKSVSKEDFAKAQSDYDVSAAEYAIAVQQLADRQLVAPFSGSIAEISLKPGAAVAPYQPLVRVVDTSRCYFVGHVDGLAVSDLRLDEPVEIQMDGTETIAAKICFISPVIDAASGLATVKAIFDNADGKIRPGIAATMTAQ